MSYNPTTDFLGIVRTAYGVTSLGKLPGLDFVIAAMARAGMIRLYTGQMAPTVNQDSTVWLRTSSPSWVAEGAVFLWNAATQAFEAATPELWAAILQPANLMVFQSATVNTTLIAPETSLLAVQRAAPVTTTLLLGPVIQRAGKPLQIVDWSTGVAAHEITLLPAGAETIMQRANFKLYSTADQLQGLTLYPSIDLDGWVIAP